MFPEQYETDITGRTGREATLSGFNEDCAAIRVRVLYSSRIPRRKAGDFLCDTACGRPPEAAGQAECRADRCAGTGLSAMYEACGRLHQQADICRPTDIERLCREMDASKDRILHYDEKRRM